MLDRCLNYMLCSLFLLSSIGLLGAEETPKPMRTRAPRPSAWVLNEGKRLYLSYCSQCHGEKGDGNGPNARWLGKKPANHTDGKKMSERTDWDLFQIVKAGGKEAAALSPLMPPWGRTLKNREVWYLVAYMRSLVKEEAAEIVPKVVKAPPKPQTEVNETEAKPKNKEPTQREPKVTKVEKTTPKVEPQEKPIKEAKPPAKLAQVAKPKKQTQETKRPIPTAEATAERVAKEPEMKPSPRRGAKLIRPLAGDLLNEADAGAVRFRDLLKFNGKVISAPLKGDPIRGRVYYAANCVTCHGPNGKGDGPTAAGMDPKPKNHTEGKTMNKKTDQHLFEVVSQGGPAKGFSDYMPSWGERLTESQIWDIVAYMRTIAEPPYKP